MFLRHISIAAIMLAGATRAFADPVGLLKDAQLIPSHRFAVATGWNHCLGVGSPKSTASQ